MGSMYTKTTHASRSRRCFKEPEAAGADPDDQGRAWSRSRRCFKEPEAATDARRRGLTSFSRSRRCFKEPEAVVEAARPLLHGEAAVAAVSKSLRRFERIKAGTEDPRRSRRCFKEPEAARRWCQR